MTKELSYKEQLQQQKERIEHEIQTRIDFMLRNGYNETTQQEVHTLRVDLETVRSRIANIGKPNAPEYGQILD